MAVRVVLPGNPVRRKGEPETSVRAPLLPTDSTETAPGTALPELSLV